jgi:hypothetical protein
MQNIHLYNIDRNILVFKEKLSEDIGPLVKQASRSNIKKKKLRKLAKEIAKSMMMYGG